MQAEHSSACVRAMRALASVAADAPDTQMPDPRMWQPLRAACRAFQPLGINTSCSLHVLQANIWHIWHLLDCCLCLMTLGVYADGFAGVVCCRPLQRTARCAWSTTLTIRCNLLPACRVSFHCQTSTQSAPSQVTFGACLTVSSAFCMVWCLVSCSVPQGVPGAPP
jgi:hypothetical protein